MMYRGAILVLLFTIAMPMGVMGQVDSTSIAPTPLDTGTERHTKSKAGRKIGVIAGGITGTALFLFGAAFGEAMCEGECSDITVPQYIGFGALGMALGALTGSLVGSLVGSMIPDHGKKASSPEENQELPEPRLGSASRPPIASIALEPGVAVLTERPENEGGFSVRATLLAQPKRWLGIGPEIAYTDVAGGVFELGGAVSIGPREPGLRPYLIGNFGWQQWKTGINVDDINPSVLAAGFGGGLSWSPGSGNTHLGLEMRYHWSPQNIQDREGYRFVSTSAVFRHSW